VLALRSQMSTLDYTVELDVKCPNRDVNNAVFIQVTTTIRGRDVVEESHLWGVPPFGQLRLWECGH
jgi:hypothetical protein